MQQNCKVILQTATAECAIELKAVDEFFDRQLIEDFWITWFMRIADKNPEQEFQFAIKMEHGEALYLSTLGDKQRFSTGESDAPSWFISPSFKDWATIRSVMYLPYRSGKRLHSYLIVYDSIGFQYPIVGHIGYVITELANERILDKEIWHRSEGRLIIKRIIDKYTFQQNSSELKKIDKIDAVSLFVILYMRTFTNDLQYAAQIVSPLVLNNESIEHCYNVYSTMLSNYLAWNQGDIPAFVEVENALVDALLQNLQDLENRLKSSKYEFALPDFMEAAVSVANGVANECEKRLLQLRNEIVLATLESYSVISKRTSVSISEFADKLKKILKQFNRRKPKSAKRE